MSTGKVYLVGSGPGDIGNLTVRAYKLLKKAEVLVFDALVDSQFLDLVPETCLKLNVGKRGGRPSMKQGDIDRLLVDYCLDDRLVVRLKSGDPFIFGRTTSEIQALKAAGCDYEVIPGISSALAAPLFADIPLTDPVLSRGFTVITAHEPERLNWQVLSQLETLVVLMGGKHLPLIVDELRSNGKSAKTPIAIVRWAGHPEQQIWISTLTDILSQVTPQRLSPCVMVIGEVVGLRRFLALDPDFESDFEQDFDRDREINRREPNRRDIDRFDSPSRDRFDESSRFESQRFEDDRNLRSDRISDRIADRIEDAQFEDVPSAAPVDDPLEVPFEAQIDENQSTETQLDIFSDSQPDTQSEVLPELSATQEEDIHFEVSKIEQELEVQPDDQASDDPSLKGQSIADRSSNDPLLAGPSSEGQLVNEQPLEEQSLGDHPPIDQTSEEQTSGDQSPDDRAIEPETTDQPPFVPQPINLSPKSLTSVASTSISPLPADANRPTNFDFPVSTPLSGKTILVTRAAGQSGHFSRLLERQGATVIEMPTLEIVPPSSWDGLDDAIANLNSFDWLILTSVNAVDYFFDRLGTQLQDVAALTSIRIAVVGEKTAFRLKQRGMQPDFIPPDFIADAMVVNFPESVSGKRFLFPRVESGGREVLVKEFTDRGAEVTEVAAYQSACPREADPHAIEAIQDRRVDIITFASSKTVKHFCDLLSRSLGDDWQEPLENVGLASIGPQTSKTSQALIGRIDIEAEEFTLEGLLSAIGRWLDERSTESIDPSTND